MGRITLAGLADGSGFPGALADRLASFGAVFAVSVDGPAAAAVRAAGIEPAALPAAAPAGLAAAIAAAGGTEGALVVLDAPLPVLELSTHPGVGELTAIMARLRRRPDGCPWDLEQTHASLRQNIIEEAYEVVDAIDADDDPLLAEELGDVLLQIAFHSQMAAEAGTFDIDDVAAGITAKLRRRHPHIFGEDEAADSAAATLARWDQIKKTEKPERTGALDGIPSHLPALMAAQKISRRAVSHGFEWERYEDVLAKVHEELDELAAARRDTPEVAEEVGDLLFTIVNVARWLGVDAEQALRGTNDKFRERWALMEAAAAESGTTLSDLPLAEQEALWRTAKVKLRERGDGPGIDEEENPAR